MYEYKAEITRVVDGDTFDAIVDVGFNIKIKKRFRVMNLDTPESWRPRNDAEKKHAMEANDRARVLLDDKIVTIRSHTVEGIYGRYSAEVILPDGRDYATVMKRHGCEKKESY